MSGVRDYSTTAASNLSVGGISIAEGMARSSVNNAQRAALADTANLLLDLGGGVATTGTGTAYVLSLPSTPTAYADNLAFVCKLHTAVSGAATININGLGVKPFKKLVNGIATDFSAGDMPAGHRADCIYSSADSAVLMLNAAVTFGTQFVDDMDEMLALPSPTVGTTIFVGPEKDQFLVVDDATLGTDGGTVFIPDSELSALTSETILPGTFAGAVATFVAMEYSLAHTGIAFESVELVLTDGGETIDIWQMHGHVFQPVTAERANCPQLPLIDTANGKFRDPYAGFTGTKPVDHPAIRTGGALLRYKYATSGLRLKRITGPVFQLRWWPAVAVDDETGPQIDNSGKICWCVNAAAEAGAEAIYVDKIYHYARCVEWPEGVEMRGRGVGLSGFRVMDNMQHTQLLLTTSSDGMAADPTVNPLLKPATRLWSYDSTFLSNSTAFFPASGASRIRISGIEFDGNIANNLRFFSQQNAEYAYTYSATNITLFNATTSAAFAITNQAARVVPDGQILELHNVSMHGYAHILTGNDRSTVISTGTLEVGDSICAHWLYLPDGVFETIRVTGYCMADGLRVRKFMAKSVEMYLYPPPDTMFDQVGNYAVRTMQLISSNEYMSQQQIAILGFNYPELAPNRVVIDNLFIDATRLDEFPAGKAYEAAIPFLINSDNIHIKSGKIRFGQLITAASTVVNTQGNVAGGHPYRNVVYENLSIEYSSRKGIQLLVSGTTDGGFAQTQFRNITFEARASTHIPGNPSPSGTNSLLGVWRFNETVLAEPVPPNYAVAYDGRNVEFSAVTVDATLNGKYIDITPPDPAAPVYRYWFNYNSAGSAPAAGATTRLEVPVASGSTTAQVAQAFSLAVAGTIASPAVSAPYLTAATFGTKSVIGAYSHYRSDTKGGYVGCSVASAAGVTTVLRAYHRNFEPSMIGFERFIANDPTYIYLMNITEIGADRDLYFSFKDCVLGAYTLSVLYFNGGGYFGTPAVVTIRDQVHCDFENTVFDFRDGGFWLGLDLMLYASRFRHCRVRTPSVATGLCSLGTGYETLVSEQGGVETWTPSGTDAEKKVHDIFTKLFWLPKDGQLQLYPANQKAAENWSLMWPEWRKSSRPVATSTALSSTDYYSVNEDRRAPALRLNFNAVPSAGELKIGWYAAVSP